MENKTIYYIIGGIAVLGIGYYFYNKSKKAGSEDSQEENVLKDKKLSDEKIAEAKLASRLTASKFNISDRLKNLSEPTAPVRKPVVNEVSPRINTPYTFAGNPRTNFGNTFAGSPRANTSTSVNNRSAFTGDFEGMINSQFMFSEFENGLNLDL